MWDASCWICPISEKYSTNEKPLFTFGLIGSACVDCDECHASLGAPTVRWADIDDEDCVEGCVVALAVAQGHRPTPNASTRRRR